MVLVVTLISAGCSPGATFVRLGFSQRVPIVAVEWSGRFHEDRGFVGISGVSEYRQLIGRQVVDKAAGTFVYVEFLEIIAPCDALHLHPAAPVPIGLRKLPY